MRYRERLALVLTVPFILTAASMAQDVTARRVTKHVTTFSMSNLGMHTNVTVIETQKGLVVVETEITPYIMGKIKEAAERELDRDDWAYVINTHAHLHHAGGNIAFPKAEVLGHETTRLDWLRDRLSTDQGRRSYCRSVGVDSAIRGLSRTLAQGTATAAQSRDLRHKLDFCRAVQKEIMAGFEVRNPTVTFRDRYTLDMGDVHLQLTYWGAGISHSSIFVHVVEDRVLVGMGMRGTWMPDFYGKPTLDSIRRAVSLWEKLGDNDLRIDLLIGVHSAQPSASRTHFRHRHRYVGALLADLTDAKRQGLTLEQVKSRFSLGARYGYARQYFTMPANLDERHQKNIETIWALLP